MIAVDMRVLFHHHGIGARRQWRASGDAHARIRFDFWNHATAGKNLAAQAQALFARCGQVGGAQRESIHCRIGEAGHIVWRNGIVREDPAICGRQRNDFGGQAVRLRDRHDERARLLDAQSGRKNIVYFSHLRPAPTAEIHPRC